VSERVTRVAMFHNEYAMPGGEDESVAMDTALLRERGIEVVPYRASNRELLEGPRTGAALALLRSHFNRRVHEQVARFCRERKPDVAHVQNFWFALSPSVHAACHDAGVATVQTLRNYRLLCVNGMLMRRGGPCEECVGKLPWRGVAHACYQGSRPLSALVARMIAHNRRRGTWEHDVDAFVALTEFARGRYLAGGLPADRIVVRPNSVGDPGPVRAPGRGAVFVGRLSPDKGVDLLLRAWQALPEVPLTIVGDGPQRREAESAASGSPRIRVLGQLSHAQSLDEIGRAALLVMASRWYEGFPRVIVEAFAFGRPVVVPRIGSMAGLVRDGVTGFAYDPGSSEALARSVRRVLEQPPAGLLAMSRAARAEYDSLYAPEINGAQLLDVYHQAIRSFRSRSGLRD
jgi:glycosyltransferase involved in cell wall biosynthesis